MRKINSRFHIDDELRIIKTSNNQPVPEDEPLLILRGRDRLALPTLMIYRILAVLDNCTRYFINEVDDSINEFQEFATKHEDRMKQPGITMGR